MGVAPRAAGQPAAEGLRRLGGASLAVPERRGHGKGGGPRGGGRSFTKRRGRRPNPVRRILPARGGSYARETPWTSCFSSCPSLPGSCFRRGSFPASGSPPESVPTRAPRRGATTRSSPTPPGAPRRAIDPRPPRHGPRAPRRPPAKRRCTAGSKAPHGVPCLTRATPGCSATASLAPPRRSCASLRHVPGARAPLSSVSSMIIGPRARTA